MAYQIPHATPLVPSVGRTCPGHLPAAVPLSENVVNRSRLAARRSFDIVLVAHTATLLRARTRTGSLHLVSVTLAGPSTCALLTTGLGVMGGNKAEQVAIRRSLGHHLAVPAVCPSPVPLQCTRYY